MTNEITKNINETIVKVAESGSISTRDISDGYHTFGELYKHRIVLFCVLCNQNPELARKSKKHFNEETDPMFKGSFIAYINTPLGPASYHIKLEFWDDFVIPEIERAPEYDGHSPDENLKRLLSLNSNRQYNK
jgi:hypothetical protein